MKKMLATLLFTFMSGSIFYSPALAMVYFKWDSEDQDCGTKVTNPPMWLYNGASASPETVCGDDTNGGRFFQWHIKDDQHDAYCVFSGQGLPISVEPGKTYYLAFRFNFTRINEKDVWCNAPNSSSEECYDKLIELTGDGVRWILSTGERGMKTPVNKYSTFIGNARPYHLNPQLEDWGSMYQNQNGYSRYNSLPLDYDRWYNAVFAINMAYNKTGSVAYYIDGVKILEHEGIRTMAYPGGTMGISMNGTISQPGYNVSEHYRKFDDLILTDDWQDIIAGGYLSPPNNNPPINVEAPPAEDLLITGD